MKEKLSMIPLDEESSNSLSEVFMECAGEKSIASPSIILESEQDAVQVDSTKIIREYSCQGFESIIDTKSPQLVKITIVE